jgi:soluble lytic murein transglycosylase-like protein
MPHQGALIALALALHAGSALADLWAYVDKRGVSHVASRQVDLRYQLFFKGETTLDAPAVPVPKPALASDPARLHRFAPLIETSARSVGIDPALVQAVVAVESAFDPRAVSGKGALGLMQILPATGERYGIQGDARRSASEKLLDPAINLRVGTRYLRDLLARFENDLSLALAAYNAGEGAVTMHDNAVPPFAETRDYVRRVTEVYARYRPPPSQPSSVVRIIHGEKAPR